MDKAICHIRKIGPKETHCMIGIGGTRFPLDFPTKFLEECGVLKENGLFCWEMSEDGEFLPKDISPYIPPQLTPEEESECEELYAKIKNEEQEANLLFKKLRIKIGNKVKVVNQIHNQEIYPWIPDLVGKYGVITEIKDFGGTEVCYAIKMDQPFLLKRPPKGTSAIDYNPPESEKTEETIWALTLDEIELEGEK